MIEEQDDLNSESIDRYEKTRTLHGTPKELIKYRYDGWGVRNTLIKLLEAGVGK